MDPLGTAPHTGDGAPDHGRSRDQRPQDGDAVARVGARSLAVVVEEPVDQYAADMSFFRDPAITKRDVAVLSTRLTAAVQKEMQKATNEEVEQMRHELAREKMRRTLLEDEMAGSNVLIGELEAAHNTIKLLLRDREGGSHTFTWVQQAAVGDMYLRITQDEDEENTTVKLTADPA